VSTYAQVEPKELRGGKSAQPWG